MNYRVYVALGFHINFYHSWRGDTPDEAGFGTDMRVIRGILDILDRANAVGQKARGYWDTEVYWTFQQILPEHCPDILQRLQRRVAAGLDEIILGPFNNGANHAATRDEFRASIQWAVENPWGSGLRQLFGKIAPLYRPQECMFTTGQESLLKENGVDGLLLYYSLVPFNSLGAFTPALPLERRYNPFWFRSREDQPPLVVFPCLTAPDLFEFASLENLMLDLHERQARGEIRSDVLIHLNQDADLESWLPVKMPSLFKWFPNTGGLEEYLAVVNKYPWADLTVPTEYLASHPPGGEVLVRQDLADGGFDGNYSWAEKCPSLFTWTLLERSRLASLRADAVAARTGLDLSSALWEGMDSAFFRRLIGLTTTHFGMSTPIINEERQARAFAILGGAAERAEAAERQAVRAYKAVTPACDDALYDFELIPTPPARDLPVLAGRTAVRLPLILPAGVEAIRVEDTAGRPVRASLTDVDSLPDGRKRAEVRFVASVGPNSACRYRIMAGSVPPAQAVTLPASDTIPSPGMNRLANDQVEVTFSSENGIESLKHLGVEIGGADLLRPFVSYRTHRRPVTYAAGRYEFVPLSGETSDGLQRLRLKTTIPMRTPHGEYASQLSFTFTLFDDLPYLYVDARVDYAYTPPTEVIHNMIQKLRRLMDLRWVEVAPFQITPRLNAPAGKTLRVWKHNYLGITSYYDLNYGVINAENRELDSFNHQVTAGWVAVSDGTRGLLVGEDAEALASMAFCPMRLRERDGRQVVSLNPFGSYYGRMFSYRHLGGSGVGSQLLRAFSGALNPNGPSYNGQALRFSLLLAPYCGDEPPAGLQAEAGLHFYPPEALVHAAPAGVEAHTADDIRRLWQMEERKARLASNAPLHAPTAVLANPIPGGAVLVWDAQGQPQGAPSRRGGAELTRYEVAWRLTEGSAWTFAGSCSETRLQIGGLEDGKSYAFRVRSVCGPRQSGWTAESACVPGAVTVVSLRPASGASPAATRSTETEHRGGAAPSARGGAAPRVRATKRPLPILALMRMSLASVRAVLRARFRKS